MPRGMPAGSDKWTFHVPRYKCPYCGRKGAIEIYYKDSGLSLNCMHRSGYKKDCKSPFLIGRNIEHQVNIHNNRVENIKQWLEKYITV